GATRSIVRSLSRGYVMSSCTLTLEMVMLWPTLMEEVVNTSGKSTGCGTSAAWKVMVLSRVRSSRFSIVGLKGRLAAGRDAGRRGERACRATCRDTFVFIGDPPRRARVGETRTPDARRTRSGLRPLLPLRVQGRDWSAPGADGLRGWALLPIPSAAPV